MATQTPVNPLLQAAVDMFGEDYYEQKWNSLSWLSKKWYTFRGYNPGGRKGAPPLKGQS